MIADPKKMQESKFESQTLFSMFIAFIISSSVTNKKKKKVLLFIKDRLES